jgi:hypothetical protein
MKSTINPNLYVYIVFRTLFTTQNLLFAAKTETILLSATQAQVHQRNIWENNSTASTVHRSRVDPRKGCESCGNAHFRERK